MVTEAPMSLRGELKAAALRHAARRYLLATRSATAAEYPHVEDVAWRRLVQDLERLGAPLRARW